MLRAPSSVSPLYANNTLVLLVKEDQPAAETDTRTASEEAESLPADSPVADSPVFTRTRAIKTAEEKTEPLSGATEVTRIEVEQDQDGVTC
jgi:hypothetical protein